MNLTITTNNSGNVSSLFRGLEKDDLLMKQLVNDYSMNSTYTIIPDPPENTSLIDSSAEYDLLIITKAKFVNAEEPKGARDWETFQSFANYKNNRGINTIIMTVEGINNSGEYDGDDNQETIRNFIKHAYKTWHIDYVLLGGDNTTIENLQVKELVPARNLFYNYRYWPDEDGNTLYKGVLPSDLYYACLDGSFNENDDAILGGDSNKLWGTPFDGAPGGDWYEPQIKNSGGIEPGTVLNRFYAECDSQENDEYFDVSLFTPSLNLKGSEKAYIKFNYCNNLESTNTELSVYVHSNGIEGEGYFLKKFCKNDDDGYAKIGFDPSNETQCQNDEDVYIEFRYKDNILQNENDNSSFNFDNVSVLDEENMIFSYGFEGLWLSDSDGDDQAPLGWEVVKHNENGGTWEQEYYRVGVDIAAEVFVGRAPVGCAEEVSNFVYKTMNYEDPPKKDPYLHKTLMVGAIMEWVKGEPTEFGGDFKKIINQKYNDNWETYGIPWDYKNKNTLFDSNYQDKIIKHWTVDELIDNLSKIPNAHIVNIKMHGNFDALLSKFPSYTWPRFKIKHVKKHVTNNNYFFVYATSCLVGAFDEEDCLAEWLTVKTEHGAFAVIMNAREGWGSGEAPEKDAYTEMLDRLFFDRIYRDYALNQNTPLLDLGTAHHLSRINSTIYTKLREEVDDFRDFKWYMTLYELNLFGDPTVSIKLPAKNKGPNKPEAPEWEKINDKDWYFKLTGKTTDDDGDMLSYTWEVDGYGIDVWSEYIEQDTETYKYFIVSPWEEHTFRVKAKDEVEKESLWSNPTTIPKSLNLNMNLESSPIVVDECVNFYGQASCGTEPYTNWYWDFGDGNFSQQQNTSHSYSSVGSYNVFLNVTDSQNISSNITKVINVVLLNADFDCSPGIAVSDQQETFYFNDKSNGYYDIVNWSWDLGDGNISYQRNTSHVYSSEGAYNVSLTVTDNESNNDTFYQMVYIDSVSPIISYISNDVNVVGYGSNVTISVNTSDNSCGIKTVKINITYPDNTFVNYSMNNTNGSIYEYDFSDCLQLGEYSYSVWVVDQADNGYCESDGGFVVSRGFGYNAIGEANQTIRNTITGSRFMVYEKGVADNISVYIDPGDNVTSDSHYQCLIYRHNDSKLIGASEQKNVSCVKRWQIFNFSVPKPVLMNYTEYVLCCWSDDNYSVVMYYDNGTGSPMYYDNGNSTLQGHYYKGIYGYPPDTNNFKHEDRKYSIYCCYTPDNTSPEITNVSDTPDPAGFGLNVTITADIAEYQSGVDIIKVNITYPNSTQYSYDMNHTGNNTYKFVFNDTWSKGQYSYLIWTVDFANNSNISTGYSFTVSGQATISVCTIKDVYSNNEWVNLTDPPSDSDLIGYELLDDGEVLHIWNRFDSYYIDTSSGIQLTNHYNDYWSHNVLMLGYYNGDQWNLIYRTDELSGFNKDIDTDSETYVNATLWKDLSYAGYDFRLAIRYHLGVDDNELTVIPYIKNLDSEAIPYILGFGWEMKDIQINMTTSGDYINVNRTMYYLNQTLDNVYIDLSEPLFYLMENITNTSTKSLYLKWNQSLNYKLCVKSREGQYNAPVTLFVRIGTLYAGQEKYTELFWYDAEQVTYYFDSFDDGPYGEAWAVYPNFMVDGSLSNWASTTSDGDVELCDENNCSGDDLGTISKVELRVCAYYSGGQRDTILRPVYGGTNDGMEYRYSTGPSIMWSEWFDITYGPYAPQPWDWDDIVSLDCDVVAENDPMGPPFTLYCSKVELRVTYTPYNYDPVISDPVPVDGATGVGIQPVLNITVSDPDGDNMNITWLSNSSGSWQVFGTNSSVGNGTYHQIMGNVSENGKWWYWMVNVSDGTEYIESSVYKFYSGYQSKIKNTGSTAIKGYLLIQVHFYNETSESWIVADDTINETTPRTINSSEQFGLDTVFNGFVNTQNLSSFGNGTYRIYAAFRDPEGNILVTDNETELMATYEFTVTFN